MNGLRKYDTYIQDNISLYKEGNSAIYNNIDEPTGHYAKWNKPVAKWKTVSNSTCKRYHS